MSENPKSPLNNEVQVAMPEGGVTEATAVIEGIPVVLAAEPAQEAKPVFYDDLPGPIAFSVKQVEDIMAQAQFHAEIISAAAAQLDPMGMLIMTNWLQAAIFHWRPNLKALSSEMRRMFIQMYPGLMKEAISQKSDEEQKDLQTTPKPIVIIPRNEHYHRPSPGTLIVPGDRRFIH